MCLGKHCWSLALEVPEYNLLYILFIWAFTHAEPILKYDHLSYIDIE